MPSLKKKKTTKKKGRGGKAKEKKEGSKQKLVEETHHPSVLKALKRLNLDAEYFEEEDDEDDFLFLEKAIKAAEVEIEMNKFHLVEDLCDGYDMPDCCHGFQDELSALSKDDEDIYVAGMTLKKVIDKGLGLSAAIDGTNKLYSLVVDDPKKRKKISSSFIAASTTFVLNSEMNTASIFAFLASYYENHITHNVYKIKNLYSLLKSMDLNTVACDHHTLVSYLKKRIPCNCLDDKYKQVKSIPKMGACCNPNCPLPNNMVDRKKMFYCTRCKTANYCSRACHKAAWRSIHKLFCDEYVESTITS